MQVFENILDRIKRMLTDWLSLKNIEQALEEMDPQVVWTGMDQGGSVRGRDNLKALFSKINGPVSPRVVSGLQLEVRAQDEQLCVVEGSFNLRSISEGEQDFCRMTLIYRAGEDGQPRLISGHVSVPILPAGVRRQPTETVRWSEYERLRLVSHDVRNHQLTMQILRNKGEDQRAQEYANKIERKITDALK